MVKNPPAKARDVRNTGSIPGSGRSPLEKGMATPSSVLAWRIPSPEEPGGGGATVHGVTKSSMQLSN